MEKKRKTDEEISQEILEALEPGVMVLYLPNRRTKNILIEALKLYIKKGDKK